MGCLGSNLRISLLNGLEVQMVFRVKEKEIVEEVEALCEKYQYAVKIVDKEKKMEEEEVPLLQQNDKDDQEEEENDWIKVEVKSMRPCIYELEEQFINELCEII